MPLSISSDTCKEVCYENSIEVVAGREEKNSDPNIVLSNENSRSERKFWNRVGHFFQSDVTLAVTKQ